MIEPATLKRYNEGRMVFEQWLKESRDSISFEQIGQLSIIGVNELLTAYVEHAFESDETYGKVVDGMMSILIAFWWFRGLLGPVWRLMHAWRLRLPVEVRRPLPPVMLKALIMIGLAFNQARFVVLVWLAYNALLRPGEVVALLRSDLIFDVDIDTAGSLPASVIVVIQKPKTRKRGPRKQHVLVNDPWLIAWLRLLFFDLPPCARLWLGTQATFARRMQRMLQMLFVPPHLFTPSSLRSGGASYEYLRGTPIPNIKFRGRWSAERSLEHYIQECLIFLDMQSLPLESRKTVHSIAAECEKLLPVFFQFFAG